MNNKYKVFKKIPIRGSILNSLAVVVGTFLGIQFGSFLDKDLKTIAISGLALLLIGVGSKMFFSSKNMLSVAMSISLGGLIGKIIGIDVWMHDLAESARQTLGEGDQFANGFLTTSILYCVGPIALMGCAQEGLRGKIELLSIKSVLDFVFSLFFAATLGAGVYLTALFLLIFQSALTMLAKVVRPLIKGEVPVGDMNGIGGLILFSIAINLLGLKSVHTECFMPAFFFVLIFSKLLKNFS